jgi:2-keto-4-pentenoate hydratase/2-oxohepta-3-ene-1,7-dioic acid hydratase in catechol pathway
VRGSSDRTFYFSERDVRVDRIGHVMRLARLGDRGREIPVVDGGDGTWRDLRPLTDDIDGAFLSNGLGRVAAALEAEELPVFDGSLERFGPPLTGIGKIVCIGLNYVDHARETGAELPSEPVMFLKAPDTVVGPRDDVLIPRSSVKTDWEIELAVIIGAEARYLATTEEGLACVGGYAISHDVSEREFQLERGGQWDKGKNCETFNPLGPWILDAKSVPNPQNLALRLWVNGTLRQNGTTSDMVFDIGYLVWYLSQFLVLRPGDVINTGTPAGVALGMPDHPYLVPGDVVELEIDGLGRQRQVFKGAE